jgi:hypothetical protein
VKRAEGHADQRAAVEGVVDAVLTRNRAALLIVDEARDAPRHPGIGHFVIPYSVFHSV